MNRQSRKKRDPGAGLRLALVALFPESWQADIAVSLLDSEGIQAFPADEWAGRKSRDPGGSGGSWVVVPEVQAPLALEILQMAQRGDLALPEEGDGYSDEWNRQKREAGETKSGNEKRYSRDLAPGTGNHLAVRCPRCGSENTARKGGIRGFFTRSYRCKVCHWQWKRK